MTLRACTVVMLLAVLGCSEQPAERWYKGNLHTHSLWSDGDDFPENIALWYRERGYHFLAISDHNTAQQGDKWVKYADVYRKGAGPAADAYLKRFSKSALTRGDRAAGNQEIRLTPFDEYSKVLNQPGKFLLIQSEEISDKFGGKPIHINATNIGETLKPQGGASVVDVIRRNFAAIKAQSQRLGRPILPHLNHPNFGWGVTAEELAEAVEEPFFEVYNGHPEIRHLGDKDHPGVEKIWDIASTMRIMAFDAPPLMGIATDDSHHYHVEGMSRSTPGRGWVCVRAKNLTPEALIAAMKAGDFYASSGVELADVGYDAATKTLKVKIDPVEGESYTTEFIGTRRKEGGVVIGETLASVQGETATYTLKGDELYVRAAVTSSAPPRNRSFKGQKKQAWTQPVGFVISP